MATSGTTAWPLTGGEIVRQAMVELGVLNAGDAPDSTEMSDGFTRLNAMLKTWSEEANLFREQSGTVTITGGTGAATLDSDVVGINSARHVVSATYHRALTQWNRDQFYALPNRAQAGSPVAYYLSRTIDGVALRLWPVPADDVTLHLDYMRATEIVDDPDQTLDVPQVWQEAVIYGLASRMANMFGATRTDPNSVQRVDAMAGQTYQKMLDRDRPDSYFVEPWGGYQYG